jgi:DnaK suppressor protein
MTPRQLNQFRGAILRLKTELEQFEAAATDAAEPVELDQARVGRLSRIDALQGQQMALETRRRRQQQVARADGALRRIDAGEYGNCFKCGQPIDLRRLTVDPTQTRCTQCVEE